MRFWDSSAIAPLITEEPARERLLNLLDADPEILAWWGTPIEIASALARRERDGTMTAEEVASSLSAARALAATWHEVAPTDSVRRTAERLLRVHALRAADSLQLAAALVAASHDPHSIEFVCLDSRLASAAQREGFNVIGP